jgi:hypothetical protein
MKMNFSILSIALLLGLLPIVSADAATYIIGPSGVVFSPGVATRVGTTANGVSTGLAGRTPFSGPLFGLQTVSGSFQGPVDNINFSGGGQVFSNTDNFLGLSPSIINGNYSFSPTVRSDGQPGGVLSTTASVSTVGSSPTPSNPNPSFTLSGASVGPVFQASGAAVTSNDTAVGNNTNANPAQTFVTSTGTVNLGAIDFVVGPGSQSTNMTLANGSNDASFVNVPALVGNQADLNILGISITGPDSAYFSLDPAQVAAIVGNTLSPGEVASLLTVTFSLLDPDALGVKTAYLTILTDQFGALGGNNQYFVFQLTGVVNPEPASMLAWSLNVGAGAVGYRLRKRKTAVA